MPSVSGKTYLDLNVDYVFNDSLTLFLGIDNIADTEPPIVGFSLAGDARTWIFRCTTCWDGASWQESACGTDGQVTSVTITRRTTLKLGLGAGALPLLGAAPAMAAAATDRCPAVDVVRCRPLPLTAVRLTGGPLKHAQEMNGRYLLELAPDRMLSYFRSQAGLAPRAEGYGGWDDGGRNLTGHIAGHYLSAVSLMWAATGDARFKERADYSSGN